MTPFDAAQGGRFDSAQREPAIEFTDVTKIYRRYGGRHFSTLKSALLQRSLSRSKPSETFAALKGVSFAVPGRPDPGSHRTQRIREEHRAETRRRNHETHERNRPGTRANFGAD
jgi:hypothetical protein